MSEFLNSRAGTQFLYTCLAAIVLWGLAMVFMREIVDYLGLVKAELQQYIVQFGLRDQ